VGQGSTAGLANVIDVGEAEGGPAVGERKTKEAEGRG
jgi:hypothetical protein